MSSYPNLPAVPDSFAWSEEPWGPALRCLPLADIAPHLFTTRQLGLSSTTGWDRLAAAMGVPLSDLRRLKQVHGRDAVVARASSRSDDRPRADVIVTNDPSLAIAVQAADCVPLLLADPKTGAVGAAHAGWRGTAAGAARAAVEALQGEFGARPADLVAAIGPSIGTCCYEVGTDLVDAFAAAGHERRLIDRWFHAPPSPQGSSARPRLRLDVWAANRDQLMLAGLQEENIHVSGVCTASNLDVMFSYRAEGEKTGRIAGVIRARPGAG